MTERERVNKAEDIALERVEYILETYSARDFVEVVGSIGGDVVRLRIYDDGSVYAK